MPAFYAADWAEKHHSRFTAQILHWFECLSDRVSHIRLVVMLELNLWASSYEPVWLTEMQPHVLHHL